MTSTDNIVPVGYEAVGAYCPVLQYFAFHNASNLVYLKAFHFLIDLSDLLS